METEDVESRTKTFNFQDWITLSSLSENAADSLQKQHICVPGSIMGLSQADIKSLKLSIGDRILFQQAQRKLILTFKELALDLGIALPVCNDTSESDVFSASQPAPGGIISSSQPSGGFMSSSQPSGGLMSSSQPSGGLLSSSQPVGGLMSSSQPVGGLMSSSQPSGGFIATQPPGGYISPTQPSGPCLNQASGTTVNYPTPSSLARDKDLADLLRMINAPFQDVIANGSTATNSNAQGKEKPLLIPDFVTPAGQFLPDEHELATSGDCSFVLKTKNNKPAPGNVTLPQWIQANARIMQLLFPSMSPSQQHQYLDYIVSVGELMQSHTIESCLRMDDAHRRNVVEYKFPWNYLDVSKEYTKLVNRAYVPKSTSNTGSRKPAPSPRLPTPPRMQNKPGSEKWVTDPDGVPICHDYNFSSQGCVRQLNGLNCKFKHACASPGCHGNHKLSDHQAETSHKQLGFR
jgi:hypothetical protein